MAEWRDLISQLVKTNLTIDGIKPLFWLLKEIRLVFLKVDGWNITRTQNAVSAATFLTNAEATANTKARALGLRDLIATKIESEIKVTS